MSHPEVICGGWSPELPEPPTPATAEVQAVVNQLRGELQSKLNLTFNAAQAVSYRSQVVAGMNYLILVSIFCVYYGWVIVLAKNIMFTLDHKRQLK